MVKKYKQEAYLTSKNIKNGKDLLSIFLDKNKKKYKNLKLVVNIHCDEIFLNPKYLDRTINFHLKNLNKYDVVIPHTITNEENNISYVKIISNQDNDVLYLTRADSPHISGLKQSLLKRHQDFVTFKPKFIKIFKKLKNRKLKYMKIELLRVLENGYKVEQLNSKMIVFQ